MIALILLGALIGVIVYSSRRARSDYVVNLRSSRPGETWTFNVRDMAAELKVTSTGKLLESFDLRRVADGRWELARIDDAAPETGEWVPCDESAASAIEQKYRRYNGEA